MAPFLLGDFMDHSARIVEAARGWVGTRFGHQGRRKANGQDKGCVDCLGLLIGVAAECGLMRDGVVLAAQDVRDYGHFPDQARLRMALEKHLQPQNKQAMQIGDVLLLRVDAMAQHVGVVGDYTGGGFSLIHAYAPARGVVEHRLDEQWRARIEAVYRFDGLSSN